MQKHYPIIIDGSEIIFDMPKVTGQEILLKAGKTPVTCFTLYIKLRNCDFNKIGLEEVIDLANDQLEHFVTKEPEVFNYTVNGEPEMTDKKTLTPFEIMRLAGIGASTHYLVQVMEGGNKKIYAYHPETPIKMLCTGMTFISEKWLAVVNIEEYGKQCREVPPARIYEVKVDKVTHNWTRPEISCEEIIGLSGKKPEKDFTVLKFTNNHPRPQKVAPGEMVSLMEKCLLRFVVQPKTQDDGRELRRQFTLPAEDIAFLNASGFSWETIAAGSHWVIISDYPIPAGYNVTKADIALLIPGPYPAAQIDMASFFPALQKANGKGINNLSSLPLDNRTFQQWSRHRKPNEWIAGVDNIATHLSLVDNWLLNDLNR